MNNWRLAQLWLPLYCTGAVLVVATGAGALLSGTPAAAGVFAGLGVVIVSYTLSMLVIAWADGMNSSWVLSVGVVTYAVKFTVIGIVLAAVAATGWEGLPAMGVGVMLGVVSWLAAQIVSTVRHDRRQFAQREADAGVPSGIEEE